MLGAEMSVPAVTVPRVDEYLILEAAEVEMTIAKITQSV